MLCSLSSLVAVYSHIIATMIDDGTEMMQVTPLKITLAFSL